jgi:hypothetical protein
VESSPSTVQTLATFTDPGGPEPNPTDPNGLPAPYIATIQWGDGTATVASPIAQANYNQAIVNSQGQITGQLVAAQNVPGIVLGSDGKTFSVNLAHQYANQGNYTITILLNHEGELSQTVTTSALVAGHDQLTATGGTPITGTFGTSITDATVATFTDTNTVSTAADFTAAITWGDGQSSTGKITGSNGSFTVTGSHTYGSASQFPIGVTISNFGGTATATANTSATINPAAPLLAVSDAGGTYNGSSFVATATAVGVDGKTPVAGSYSFSYYSGTSASGTPLVSAPSSAGTYTVVATFTSSDLNYTSGGTAQTTFTIIPAAPTLSVTDAGGTYNGQPFAASAAAVGIDGKTTVSGSFSFAYYAGTSATGTPLGAAPVNAGTYTVVATFTSTNGNYSSGGTAQTTFTTKATAPTLRVSDASGPYTGTAYGASGSAVGVDGKTVVSGSWSYTYYSGTSASGTPLSGAPSAVGTYTVVGAFTSSDPNYTGGTAQTTFTIGKATTSLSKLTVTQIVLGTGSATLSGQLTSSTTLPVGQSIAITLNGVTKTATIQSDGTFSASFATSSLAVGKYTISYSYAGDANFSAASGSGSLTVAYGTKLLFDYTKPVHAGLPLPIILELTNASGSNVSSANVTVTATSLVAPNGMTITPKSFANLNPNDVFAYVPLVKTYGFVLDTSKLSSGTWTLNYTAGNDPTTHSLTFVIG